MSLAAAAEREVDDRQPLAPLTAALIAAIGLFGFCAMLVLFTYAPELDRGDNGQAHALSKSAVGFAGAVKALRLAGEPVVINRAPLGAGRRSGLLILTPPPQSDRKAIDALGFDGPVLVILPKWEAPPDVKHRGWVTKGPLIAAQAGDDASMVSQLGLRRRAGVARAQLSAPAGLFAPGTVLRTGAVDRLQTIAAPGWIAVVTDETGAAVLVRDARAPLYVLADPDLLNTQGLADIDTFGAGLAVLRALRAGDGPFIFDVRLNGLGRQRTPLRLLFDPPFLGATLSLALAAALAGLQAFCRFGPVRRGGRAIPLGKTALVDNTAALIRLAGREHRMGGRFADLTAELAARSVGAPRALGGEALIAFLDRLSAQRGMAQTFSQLAGEARAAQSPVAVTAAAARLFAWRIALTGETGATVSLDRPGGSGLGGR